MASSSGLIQPTRKLSWKKTSSLYKQLWSEKESLPMADYLVLKLEAAENLRRFEMTISDNDVKNHIFNGLPMKYAEVVNRLRLKSLAVVGTELVAQEIKFHQENGGASTDEGSGSDSSPTRHGGSGFDGSPTRHRHRHGSPTRHRHGSPTRHRHRHGSPTRNDQESYIGHVMVVMVLVLTLMFDIAKPSENLFASLKQNNTYVCAGSGLMKMCDYTPYHFMVYEGIVVGGFTLAVLLVIRLMDVFPLYNWVRAAMLVVYFAFGWNIYVSTPWQFRLMVVEIDVCVSVAIWIICFRKWIWVHLHLKELWELTKTNYKKIWDGCKTWDVICFRKWIMVHLKELWELTKTNYKKIWDGCKTIWNVIWKELCGDPAASGV